MIKDTQKYVYEQFSKQSLETMHRLSLVAGKHDIGLIFLTITIEKQTLLIDRGLITIHLILIKEHNTICYCGRQRNDLPCEALAEGGLLPEGTFKLLPIIADFDVTVFFLD